MLNFIRGNFLTFTAGVLLIGPFLFAYYLLGVVISAPLLLVRSSPPDPYFHLLVPSPATNGNVCRSFLSARILGYPDPIFVGWDEKDQFSESEAYRFKIGQTLNYLKNLPAKADTDIVLVLDVADVWLQLRPDVLIKRYYDVLDRANDRLKKDRVHGKLFAGADVSQQIVFGADKLCAPQKESDPACWAVPESTLSEFAFGPQTDKGELEVRRPRWLNSGTIMGPAAAMRDMFEGAMDVLHAVDREEREGHPSDQFYFSEIFAEQELNRHKLRNNSFEAAHPELPKIPDMKRTEYHITLDYESELFQVFARYENHITFMRHQDTTPASLSHSSDGRMPRPDELRLSPDVKKSDPPYTGSNGKDGLPFRTDWVKSILGVNTVTGLPIPVMHLTNNEQFRDAMWGRMWFQGSKDYGKRLFKAAAERLKAKPEHTFVQVGSIKYHPASFRLSEYRDERQGGVWTSTNEWMPFDDVCGDFDDALYPEYDKGWFDVGFPTDELDESFDADKDKGDDKKEDGYDQENQDEQSDDEEQHVDGEIPGDFGLAAGEKPEDEQEEAFPFAETVETIVESGEKRRRRRRSSGIV
jgi:hypothetical protein